MPFWKANSCSRKLPEADSPEILKRRNSVVVLSGVFPLLGYLSVFMDGKLSCSLSQIQCTYFFLHILIPLAISYFARACLQVIRSSSIVRSPCQTLTQFAYLVSVILSGFAAVAAPNVYRAAYLHCCLIGWGWMLELGIGPVNAVGLDTIFGCLASGFVVATFSQGFELKKLLLLVVPVLFVLLINFITPWLHRFIFSVVTSDASALPAAELLEEAQKDGIPVESSPSESQMPALEDALEDGTPVDSSPSESQMPALEDALEDGTPVDSSPSESQMPALEDALKDGTPVDSSPSTQDVSAVKEADLDEAIGEAKIWEEKAAAIKSASAQLTDGGKVAMDAFAELKKIGTGLFQNAQKAVPRVKKIADRMNSASKAWTSHQQHATNFYTAVSTLKESADKFSHQLVSLETAGVAEDLALELRNMLHVADSLNLSAAQLESNRETALSLITNAAKGLHNAVDNNNPSQYMARLQLSEENAMKSIDNVTNLLKALLTTIEDHGTQTVSGPAEVIDGGSGTNEVIVEVESDGIVLNINDTSSSSSSSE